MMALVNSIMSEKKKRNIFFLFLAVLFLLTALLIIPYSMGYRFSFERGIFVFTGSITLKSTPRDIAVSIDGKPAAKGRLSFINDSYHIGGLNPGEHQIEVSAEGFQPWRKKASISSGISTEFWNILLARDSFPRTRYQTPGAENFFYDAQKNMAAYIEKDPAVLRVGVLDLNTDLSGNIFNSDDYRFTDDPKENIEWSPETFKLIIPAIKEGRKNYFVVDTDTRASTDLAVFSGDEDLRKVRWDPTNRNYLFYISQNNLYRLNINDAQDKKLVVSQIASFDFSDKKVFYLQLPSSLIFSIDPEGSSAPVQITTQAPEEALSADSQIIVYDERRIALLDPKGLLYMFNDGEKDRYFRKLSDQARGIQFSDDGKKMLFWNDWEIATYFVREWKVQPFRQENETKEVIRFSEKLSNVQWAKDYEHVLLSSGDAIKIVEIDHRDQKNLTDMATITIPNTKLVSDFPDNKLYFTDQAEDGTSYIYSIDFPAEENLI